MGTAFEVDAEVARLIQQKLVELPTYPGVALKLQKLLSGGDYDFEALTRLVQADQALTAQVMRAANSAFYRATTPITTLSAAIGRIGAKELANIAIAGTLGLSANAQGPLASLRKDAWRLALTTAVIAQELAPSENVNPGEAFLAGLLHDFGVTIALACFEVVLELHPDVTPRTLEQWNGDAQRFHVELGLALAADWKLPAFVSEVIVNDGSDDVTGLTHAALVKLVARSSRVAQRLLAAPSVQAAKVGEVHGLTARALEKLDGLFPRVPSYLQSFEEAAPEPAPAPRAAPPPAPPKATSGTRPAALGWSKSTVQSAPAPDKKEKQSPVAASPPKPLSADRREVNLPAAVVKKGARVSYRAVECSRESLKLVGAHAQGERQLLNLEVEKLQLCATVQSCTPSPEGFVLDLKPFAMNGATAAQYDQLGRSKAA